MIIDDLGAFVALRGLDKQRVFAFVRLYIRIVNRETVSYSCDIDRESDGSVYIDDVEQEEFSESEFMYYTCEYLHEPMIGGPCVDWRGYNGKDALEHAMKHLQLLEAKHED